MLYIKLFYFISLFYEISNEVILKIDLDETTDKQTTANNLFITYINATGLKNGNVTMNLIAKNNMFPHQLYKRNPDSSPMYVPFDIGNKIDIPREKMAMPLLQKRGDSSKIKKHLDDFKMIKRPTYISTPKFDFPFLDLNSTYDTQYDNYISKPKFDYPLMDLNSKYDHVQSDNYYRRQNMVEESTTERHEKIFEVLTKQNRLIERIATSLLLREEKKRKIARTYFDDILESVEKRQSTVKVGKNKTKTISKKKTTMRTIIDETEIRNALKNDPFVGRILRLAGKKKQEFEKQRDQENGYLV